jgi:diphthine-ammonia ligase
MKAFVSWSGGKDCMLALHRFLRNPENEAACLVNMCDNQSEQSRSHGLSRGIIGRQAKQLNIALIQERTSRSEYEANFKQVIGRLRKTGVTAGVFGDIYLMEHRSWIERVCQEAGVEAIFPLWGYSTTDLLNEFIAEGFQALTVSVRTSLLPESFLGRTLDERFLQDILALGQADPCAENGEYHSFVYDGPLFSAPVSFEKKRIYHQDHHQFLEIQEA